MNIAILAIITLFLITTKCQIEVSPCFGAQMIYIWQGDTSIKLANSAPYLFNCPFSKVYNSMAQHGLVLNGFQANTPWISFDVSVANLTTNSVGLNINILPGSGISILQFGIIMTNYTMTYYIHIYPLQHIFQYLNSSRAGKSGTDSEQLLLYSVSYFLAYKQIKYFMTSFEIKNLGNHQKIDLSPDLYSSNTSSYAKVTFTVNWNCQITRIRFVAIRIQQGIWIKPNYFSLTGNLSNTNIPSIFGPNFNSKCLLGLEQFRSQDISSNPRYQLLYSISPTGINQINEILSSLRMGIICVMQCAVNTLHNNGKCQPCSKAIVNCATCEDTYICTSCFQGYYLFNGVCNTCSNVLPGCYTCSSETKCLTCLRGRPVVGGCTEIPGCIKVKVQKSSIQGKGNCQACDYPEFMVNTDGYCDCRVGDLAGQVCISIIGCSGAIRQNGTNICVRCNKTSNFQLDNQNCTCEKGYQSNGKRCQPICGDGLFFVGKQQCDDGNFINGDGCNQYCRVQQDYICQNNSLALKNCVFIGKNLTMKLIDMNKLQDENKGIFAFQIYPHPVALGLVDYSRDITFTCVDCSLPISIDSISYSEGTLKIIVDFFQDLQNLKAHISLVINSTLLSVDPMSIDFTQNGSRNKLRLHRYFFGKRGILIMEIGIMAITVLIFASYYFDKMVGVETIHTFQLIYFVHFYSSYYSEHFNRLSPLTHATGNFMYFSNRQHLISPKVSNLQFSEGNLMIVEVILAIIFIVYIVFYHINRVKKENWGDKLKNKLWRTFYLIYNKLVYPTAISFVYTVFLFAVSNNFRTPKAEAAHFVGKLQSIGQIVSVILVFSVFCYEWKLLIVDKIESRYEGIKNCKPFYIPAYLTYTLCMVTLLSLQLCGLMDSLIPIAAVTLFMLIFCILGRPYQSVLNNVGIIFNHLFVLGFLVLLLLKVYLKQLYSEFSEYICVITTFSLLAVSFLLFTLRVIMIVRSLAVSKLKQKKSHVSKHLKNQQILLNKYCDRFATKLQQTNIYSLSSPIRNIEDKIEIQEIKDKLKKDRLEPNIIQPSQNKLANNVI